MKQKIRVLHYLTVVFLLGMHPAVHASLSCTIVNFDVWDAGFNINVSVTNNGTQPVNPWEVELTFNQSVQIINFWNAQVTLNGLVVEATGLSHNAVLNPGQSVSFGFQGSHSSGSNLTSPVCTEGGNSSSSSSSSTSSSSSSTSTSTSSTSTSSTSSSSSSGSTSGSSSSSGGPSYSNSTPVCPNESNGVVIGTDPVSPDYPLFNPDDYEGSKVYFRDFTMLGGPGTAYSRIRYANGSDFNRPMRLEHTYAGSTYVIEQLDFPPTGGWDVWVDLRVDQSLSGQNNLISLSPEGGPNLARITTVVTCSSLSDCGAQWGDSECPGSSSSSSSSSTSSSSSSSSTGSSSSSSGGA